MTRPILSDRYITCAHCRQQFLRPASQRGRDPKTCSGVCRNGRREHKRHVVSKMLKDMGFSGVEANKLSQSPRVLERMLEERKAAE